MTTNEELIERAAVALYEAERADSEVGQHWISWEALIEKDREHPERGEKWGAGKYRRHAAAVLAAVSDTTPSEKRVVRHNEWQDGSYQEVYSDGSSGPVVAPTPSEGEREGLEHRMVLAKIVSEWGAALYTMEETVDRLAALTPPVPVDREKLTAGLEVAMLGDTDGGLIDPDSDIPAGEMYRLAREYLEAALAVSPAPACDEWEAMKNETPTKVEMTDPVWVMRGGAYLLDEHAGVLIDSAGNFSAKTRGNPRSLVVLLHAIAESIEDELPVTEEERDG